MPSFSFTITWATLLFWFIWFRQSIKVKCKMSYTFPIPGVPEKAERWIFSTLRAESVVYFYIIRWSIFRRREWCLDHSIWLSNFDSMTISWNTVIFKFRWIFATNEQWIVAGQTFHTVFLWKSVDPWQQKKHWTMGFHMTTYGLSVSTKFFAHPSQKSSEIWKWPYFRKWS